MFVYNKLELTKYWTHAESLVLQSKHKLAITIQSHVPKIADAYQRLEKMPNLAKVALIAAALTPLFYYVAKKLYSMVPSSSTEQTYSAYIQKINKYFSVALHETERLKASQPQNQKGRLHDELFARFAALHEREEKVSHFDAAHPHPFSREESWIIHQLGTTNVNQLMQRDRIYRWERGRR